MTLTPRFLVVGSLILLIVVGLSFRVVGFASRRRSWSSDILDLPLGFWQPVAKVVKLFLFVNDAPGKYAGVCTSAKPEQPRVVFASTTGVRLASTQNIRVCIHNTMKCCNLRIGPIS